MAPALPIDLNVLFVAGFGPIVTDQKASEKLYVDLLRLPLNRFEDNETYWFTDELAGVKHFALWPLDQAALSCFGVQEWPADVPVPQAWLEFEVADMVLATQALEQAGYTLLVGNRLEPWGQTVTRFLSPEGVLAAVTHTPELLAHE